MNKFIRPPKACKLALKKHRSHRTVIPVGEHTIGDGSRFIIAGPCAVETQEQITTIAKGVRNSGACCLRGGAFKPRQSPYSFQGLGASGLKYLKKAKKETNLPIVTEVMDSGDLPLVSKFADVLQIGSHNMFNYGLLKKAASYGKPILLKRGMAARLDDLLLAAEYILKEGNENVVLCERGIRTFADHTRNMLDFNIIPIIKKISHLPILVDPSHSTGVRSLVPIMCKAAIVAGADGLMIEVHNNPSKARCDGQQSITLGAFKKLMGELRNNRMMIL